MTEAFFVPAGDGRFTATPHAAGPWTPEAQHFGPPSALLVRALEQQPADRPTLLARVTIEILGPAPVGTELTVRSALDRPGRSVELLSAELAAAGRTIARASAWRFTTSDSGEVAVGGAAPLPPVADAEPTGWPEGWGGGYLEAMEWLAVRGAPDQPGPASAWVRQRVALVDGEDPTPLQRLFTVADSGNGVSNRLDPRAWWFINSELTVHIQRPPEGEWIGLDAATVVGPHGVGTAHSVLHDTAGQVGFGAQTLLVRPR
ncbi:TesB-like acyl-CoA thioesterase 5 [Amycolatopsis antarctica]|uniref:TesB-like acyl-CoA thioesterase 5 n=1 Tax=Amycolatopsis antarctica TaxID=1854586 RepID=A0A263D3C3_9PSEU|nr:thioesterase family protein [Amycolatopsis antarctica]OZM72974.1 TesB-like acyl-CoA thioesterase 5 [Amycolatopsis antarctica]